MKAQLDAEDDRNRSLLGNIKKTFLDLNFFLETCCTLSQHLGISLLLYKKSFRHAEYYDRILISFLYSKILKVFYLISTKIWKDLSLCYKLEFFNSCISATQYVLDILNFEFCFIIKKYQYQVAKRGYKIKIWGKNSILYNIYFNILYFASLIPFIKKWKLLPLTKEVSLHETTKKAFFSERFCYTNKKYKTSFTFCGALQQGF